MKVSIITVTYNSESSLQHTIDSVVSQNYADIEHIVVDGGSNDSTLDIIQKNTSIAKYISEPDKGIYDAINKGIRLATGDIVGILNSDDTLAAHDSISQIVECMKSNGSDMVYGDLIYVTLGTREKVIRHWKSNDFKLSSLRKGWMAAHPTLYCKKSVYDTYGLYNETLRIAADYDFMLRTFQRGDLKKSYLPVTLVKMSWGGESNRSVKNIIQKSKEDYLVIKQNEIGGIATLIFKNLRKFRQFL